MKIFIAGAKAIASIDELPKQKIASICHNGFEILVGDCTGIDSAVQEECLSLMYRNVVVYASNGYVRNNLGKWPVKAVQVPPNMKGFDFYAQKDIAMADDADYGFMIWDGVSRGTLSNLVNLAVRGKSSLVYLHPIKKMVCLKNLDDVNSLVSKCPTRTRQLYQRVVSAQHTNNQLSVFAQ